MIGGGAAKPAHLHTDARALLGVPIVSGYGLSECPGLAYNHVDDSDDVLASDGRAVAGVEIRIVGREGDTLVPGQEGEIRARGPMLFLGYLDAALDGDAIDDNGWLRTGDLGRLDEGGNLRVTGRIKDVLAAHTDVADVAVVGLPDPERGERCCAVVVPRDLDRPP